LFISHAASKAIEARVTCPVELFDEYECGSGGGDGNDTGTVFCSSSSGGGASSLKFCVNLKLFLDCLHLFGSAMELASGGSNAASGNSSGNSSGSSAMKSTTSATLSYDCADCVFRVSLEECGVVTMCELSTLLDDGLGNTASSAAASTSGTQLNHGASLPSDLFNSFRASAVVVQIIMNAEPLKDVVGEVLETSGNDAICVRVMRGGSASADQPHRLIFSAEGSLESCDIELSE
jgi:hypothetical protein